jgi:uncharacterized protein involved in exopolysaccharide biosynthesis
MPQESILTLRDILNVVFRRIIWLKVIVPLLTLSVLVACLIAKPSFETTAKVMITAKKETPSLLVSSGGAGPSKVINLNVDEADINSEMEILNSIDLWTKTVKAIGLESLAGKTKGWTQTTTENLTNLFGNLFSSNKAVDPEKEQDNLNLRFAQGLLANFKVTPAPRSRVIDLSLKFDDPEMVQRILSKLLELYVPYHLQVYSMPGAQAFFTEQVDQWKNQYVQADRDLIEFRRRWNIALPERQKSELIAQVKQLEDLLTESYANLSQYETMLTLYKQGSMTSGQLTPSSQRGNENTVMNVIAVQLLQAEQKRLQNSEIFTVGSRDYQASMEQMMEISKKFQDTLNSEVALLNAKKTTLEEALSTKREQLLELLVKSEEARSKQLDVTVAKEQYLQYLAKEEAAKVDNLESREKLVDVKVIGWPIVPNKPVFPKTGLFVLGGFFFSIFLGLGMIFLANFFDFTFDSPKELESATGHRVLATFGKLKNKNLSKTNE